MGLHVLIAQGQLLVRALRQIASLPSGKEMLGAPGALQGLGNLVLTLLTMGMASLRQREGITFPSEHRCEDRHARNARQLTHDLGACEVHLL
jgi:hypothetical protein